LLILKQLLNIRPLCLHVHQEGLMRAIASKRRAQITFTFQRRSKRVRRLHRQCSLAAGRHHSTTQIPTAPYVRAFTFKERLMRRLPVSQAQITFAFQRASFIS
jgi:hypothetical protein